ncbi:MAG: hypothetical protein ABJG47_13400 [Ekhidna sp.]
MKYFKTVAVLILMSCAKESDEQSQSTHPVWSHDGTMIAFINNAEGVAKNNAIDFEVFTMNADGSNLRQHTFNDAFEADLAWSNDGSKVAFKSYRDENDEVYVLNLEDGVQVNVSNHAAYDGSPQFVKGALFFESERDTEIGELYRYDFMSNSIIRLTNNDYRESGAVWSSDGKLIVFTSNMDGDDDLYLMKSNGDSLVKLTDNPLNDWYPQWSPDNESILFTYGDWETDKWELRRLDLETLDETTILSGNDSGNASCHPLGTTIAYASSKLGAGHVFLFDLNTKEETQLTE